MNENKIADAEVDMQIPWENKILYNEGKKPCLKNLIEK